MISYRNLIDTEESQNEKGVEVSTQLKTFSKKVRGWGKSGRLVDVRGFVDTATYESGNKATTLYRSPFANSLLCVGSFPYRRPFIASFVSSEVHIADLQAEDSIEHAFRLLTAAALSKAFSANGQSLE